MATRKIGGEKSGEEKAEKTVFAAIYARTSSPNQRFNYSIKEQVNSCWKYCKDREWKVKYVFIDESESGKNVNRPKFQLMLEKAEKTVFNVIVFWKLDRFCRSLADLVNIERTLRNWNIGLCSVTEFIDTITSVGRFNFRNLASVAELERELIGERSKLGMYALAKQHKWPNPHPPLGYEKDREGRLLVNKEEAELVRRIFKMYVQQMSMPQVAFELNREGIFTKKGKKWNARAIRDVLTDELYVGKYRVAGVADYIEEYRVVDTDLFKEANMSKLRFKESKAKRPPMPEDRRMEKVDRIFDEFLKLLRSTHEDNECPPKTSEERKIKEKIFSNYLDSYSPIEPSIT